MKYVLRVYPLAVISSNIASSPVVGENAVSVNQTGALVRFNAPRRYIPLHLKYYTNTQHSLTYKAVQVWLKSGYTYDGGTNTIQNAKLDQKAAMYGALPWDVVTNGLPGLKIEFDNDAIFEAGVQDFLMISLAGVTRPPYICVLEPTEENEPV